MHIGPLSTTCELPSLLPSLRQPRSAASFASARCDSRLRIEQTTVQASSLGLDKALRELGVRYKSVDSANEYLWEVSDEAGKGQMNGTTWAGEHDPLGGVWAPLECIFGPVAETAIAEMHAFEMWSRSMTESESLTRTVVDILLFDRLRLLCSDQDLTAAARHLRIRGEVNVRAMPVDARGAKRSDRVITGRSDWQIGHGDEPFVGLISMEGKKVNSDLRQALGQNAVYMGPSSLPSLSKARAAPDDALHAQPAYATSGGCDRSRSYGASSPTRFNGTFPNSSATSYRSRRPCSGDATTSRSKPT